MSEVTHYILYFSMDANGTNRSYLDNASVGIDNITVPVDTTMWPFTHMLVYTLTSLVEQTTPAYHLIFDAYASVSDISFTDKEYFPKQALA